MRDIAIRRVGITDLRGLENLGSFKNELSIENNPNLVSLQLLGSNLPEGYRTSIRNIYLRNNLQLTDVEGLRYIETIDG